MGTPLSARATAPSPGMRGARSVGGGKVKQDNRVWLGYRVHRNRHQHTGEGNEIWVQQQWGRYVCTLLDEPYALLVPISKYGWGVGAVGSVHMAQRSEEGQYVLQLAVLRLTLGQGKGGRGVIMGDWNRDIRSHALTQAFLKKPGGRVCPVQYDQPLLKDETVTYGVAGRSRLLPHVADHPLLLTMVSGEMHTVTDMVPLRVYGWGTQEYKIFGDLLEAHSLMAWLVHEWVELCRHLLYQTKEWQQAHQEHNHATRTTRFRCSPTDIAEEVHKLQVRDGHDILGKGMTSHTMRVLRLKGEKSFESLRKVYDSRADTVVVGEQVLQVAPRECASKHTRRQHRVTSEWAARCWAVPKHMHDQGLGEGRLGSCNRP